MKGPLSERRVMPRSRALASLGARLAVFIASLAVLSACGESAPPPPKAPPVIELPKPEELIRLARKAEQESFMRTQVQRGYMCGWHTGWMRALDEARRVTPSRFRSDAMGSAFGWGVITLAIGFGGVFVLAWVLPRLRRRPKRPTPEPEGKATWPDYFKGLFLRMLQRVGQALRVEQFDPLLASERQRAIESCRDTERQLGVSLERLGPISAERPERAAAFAQSVETWRSEVMLLRRRLEGPGTLPRELAPDRIGPRIEVTLRAARDLRLRIERLATLKLLGSTQEAPTVIDTRWAGLEHELADRPETPRDRHEVLSAELPGWVRLTGYLGLCGVGLGLPMMAAWMAAGAFPLFFVLLFVMGGLGATLLARIHLHRAGRLPLLPGFADRVASWLTGVAALALVVVIGSSWMSAESGLDMGDPPPVALHDPALAEAPLLWPDVSLHPRPLDLPSVTPTPEPAPGPPATPSTAPPGGATPTGTPDTTP